MIDNTINAEKTIVGGGQDVILAGRYYSLHQLGELLYFVHAKWLSDMI